MLTINVRLLDGSVFTISADRKDKGEVIFDAVCEHLFLEEKDYFGLQYEDKTGLFEWLELDKRLGRLFKPETWELLFAVKFYPPDPSQLQEDVTRYQLCLQVRNDILSGKLPCSFPTYAMLASYLVQSQIGDYSPEEHSDTSYLQGFRFAPEAEQTPELEAKVVELHRTHKGQTPAEADLHYLENAKKLAMYGVDFHHAKDSEGVEITLGVCSTGLQVYRQMLRINRFAWPKILKISYKRNNFYIKIRPGNYEQIENTVGFKLADHRSAKRLWKTCVEHHTFFRLMTPEDVAKPGLLPRLSSRYRYSRRTQYMTKQSTIDRDQPTEFRKSIRGVPIREVPSSKSLDPLMPQQNNDDSKENKRHTMSHPPQRIPGVDPSPKKDKDLDSSASSEEGDFSINEKPVGGVAVLPTDFGKKKKKESPLKEAPEKENGVNDSDEEKENRDSVKKTKSPIGFGRFIGGKDKKAKGDKLEEMGVVREYEYEEKDEEKKRRMKGFSYEKKSGENENKDDDGAKSPSKISKAKAFNYSPKKDEGFGIFKKKKEEDKDESIEMKSKEKKGFLSSLKKPESPESKTNDKKEDNKEKKGFLSSLKRPESPESKDVKKNEANVEKESKDKKSTSVLVGSKGPESPRSKGLESPGSKGPESLGSKEPESGSKTGTKKDDLTSDVKTKDKKGFLSSLKRPESPESKGLQDEKKKDEKKKYGFLSNLTSALSDDKRKDKDKKNLNSSDLEKNKDESHNTSSESRSDEKKLDTSSSDKKKNKDDKSLDTSLTKKDDKKKDSDNKSDKKKLDSSIDKKTGEKDKKSDKSKDNDKKSDKSKDNDKKSDKSKDDDKKSADKAKDDKKAAEKLLKEKDDKKKEKDAKKTLDTSLEKKDEKKLNSPDAEKKKDSFFGFLSKKPGSPDAKNKDKNKDLSESAQNSSNKKGTKSETGTLIENGKTDDKTASESFILAEGKGPKIVKTTTKQSLVKDGGNTTRNIEEKIEDMETGDITLNSEESQLEDTTGSPYVTATAVTTRTAMTTEDLGTNAKTSQVEEKTVARTTTHSGTRQEQRVVTQEVRATTVVSEPPQDFRRSSMSSTSSDDSGTPIDGDYARTPGTKEPIVETESVFLVPGAGDGQKINSSPLVPASASLIGPVSSETVVTGEIVSSQMITSKSRTVETVTYKTEKDGVVETRVEQKITIQSDGDPIDHDKALAEAIQEATAMNPDMQVEKIEIQQESLPN